jgi:hypothetical protein
MRYDVWFLVAAVLYLGVGEAMGTWMGITEDFALAPVHAHVNLLGWATLALFGLAYRAYPALAASRLAPVQFTAATLGAGAMGVGIFLSITYGEHNVVAAATLMVLASTMLFFANLLINVVFVARTTAHEPPVHAGLSSRS